MFYKEHSPLTLSSVDFWICYNGMVQSKQSVWNLCRSPRDSFRSEAVWPIKVSEKMLDFWREETMKRERNFISMFTNFKSEVNFTRIKLKLECSKAELEEMIEILEQCKTEVEQVYKSLQTLTTPFPDIRRKLDTCTSVTYEVIIILEEWQNESNQIFNSVTVKKSIFKLL